MRHGILIAGIGLLVASHAVAQERKPTPDGTLKPEAAATAKLLDANGADKGTATLLVAGGVMRVLVDVRDLPRGPHGIHIHTTGRCDAPAFTTAGPHWNPTARQHGHNNPSGKHAGDFKNITVNRAGKGTLSTDVPGDFAALMDEDGASIVIHAKVDDYRTDPSGNSGDRIVCGVFTRPIAVVR